MVKLVSPTTPVVTEKASIGAPPSFSSLGEGRAKLGEAYLAESKKTSQAISLSRSITSASDELQQYVLTRQQQVVDDKGNPTYSTLSSDIQAAGTKIRNKYLNSIGDYEVSDSFNLKFQAMLADATLAAQSTARNQELKFAEKTATEAAENAMRQASLATPEEVGKYENQALSSIRSLRGSLDPLLAAELEKRTIEGMRNVANLNLVQQRSDEAIAAKDSSGLEKLYEEYTSKNAAELGLSVKAHHQLISEVRRSMKTVADRIEAEEKANVEGAKQALKYATASLERGQPMPAAVAKELSESLSEGDYAALTMIEEASLDMVRMSTPERTRALQVMADRGATEEYSQMALEVLTKLDEDLTKQEKEDPVALLKRQDLIAEPTKFDPAQGNLALQLERRNQERLMAKSKYGLDSHGLTQAEVYQLQTHVQSLPAAEKAKALAEVVSALTPEQSTELFSDMNIKNGRELAFGGMMTASGRADLAHEYLSGLELLKNKDLPRTSAPVMDRELATVTLPNYFQTRQREDIVRAVEALYTDRAFRAGELDPNIVDPGLLKEATRDATNGGAIEYNGSLIEPPVFGMDESDFEDWARSITAAELGPVTGTRLTAEEIMENATLRNIGRGAYIVHLDRPGEPSVLLRPNGNLLILDYEAINNRRRGGKF